jgi:hypothetical protein
MSDLSGLKNDAIAIVVLTVITLTAIAVANIYKQTGVLRESTSNTSTDLNATADKFVVGLAIFGTFAGILALVAIGRVVFKMFGR